MAELLRAIFVSDEFMPHGHCLLWKPGLLWLHVTSDGLIGTAYVAIAIMLWFLVRRSRVPFSMMFVAFVSQRHVSLRTDGNPRVLSLPKTPPARRTRL